MTAVGVLSNQLSTGNREGLERVRAVLARHRDVPHEETATPEALDAALARLARAGVELLVLNGGDGTVQAVLTRLQGETTPFRRTPALAVLRGGNTSMIAADCGLAGAPHRALARLLAGTRGHISVERVLVGMRLTPAHAPVYGMFFGTAAIMGAIRLTRRSMHPVGLTGAAGPTVTLVLLLLQLLLGRVDGEVLKPEPLAPAFDGEPAERREHLLFLTTTLERLFIGMRPYWGNGSGGLHCTGVLEPHRRLVRSLPALLRGRPNRHLTGSNGYYSRRADHVSLAMDCAFTLDGEIYQPEAGQPVLLSGERRATFVCG